MTLAQQIITVGMCVLATLLTRFLPFAVFNARKPLPSIFTILESYCPVRSLPCW